MVAGFVVWGAVHQAAKQDPDPLGRERRRPTARAVAAALVHPPLNASIVSRTSEAMVQVQDPRWHLKRHCPICEQGSSLLLVSCPSCGHLAVRCEEEGTFFMTPEEDTVVVSARMSMACPTCSKKTTSEFVPATDEVIRAAGLSTDDFE